MKNDAVIWTKERFTIQHFSTVVEAWVNGTNWTDSLTYHKTLKGAEAEMKRIKAKASKTPYVGEEIKLRVIRQISMFEVVA